MLWTETFKVWGYSFNETLLAGTTKEGTSRDIEVMRQLWETADRYYQRKTCVSG